MHIKKIVHQKLEIEGVCHGFFTRKGGVSKHPYNSLNCSFNVEDNQYDVMEDLKLVCNQLKLEKLIKLVCENPCDLFGIKHKGYIKENYDADLTIVDMNKEVVIKDDWIESKCVWTPFNNYKVKGFPVATIVNGEIVMENSKIISPAKGKPLNF